MLVWTDLGSQVRTWGRRLDTQYHQKDTVVTTQDNSDPVSNLTLDPREPVELELKGKHEQSDIKVSGP